MMQQPGLPLESVELPFHCTILIVLAVQLIQYRLFQYSLLSYGVQISQGVVLPFINLGRESNHTAWFQLAGHSIDTAYIYGDGSQREAGAAFRLNGMQRSDIFIINKVPCCPHHFFCGRERERVTWPALEGEGGDHPRQLAEKDLLRLVDHDLKMVGTKYFDLLLLHNPCELDEQSLWAYKEIERAMLSGRAHAIGVSNFDALQIKALIARAAIKPAVNQVKYSLGVQELAVDRLEWERLGVTTMAWGPLGHTSGVGVQRLIHNPTILSVARHVNRTGAQIALRWLVQKGIPFATSGYNVNHYEANLKVAGFDLSTADMNRLEQEFRPA